MRPWSDSPIHPYFSLKLFVDTNILSYLVDDTYPSLTEFINQSKECKFIELVSSRFVIFEFVGIRKKEHYLRKIATASKVSAKGEVNFSSLLKYQNSFDAPEAHFDSVITDIRQDVEKELEKIATDYKINFEYSILHEDQLSPTFEICLSCKIANQDSLVLISSVLPQPKTTTENVQLLTNDGDFVKSFKAANIDHVFTTNKLSKPAVHPINSIPGVDGAALDLTKEAEAPKIVQHLKDKVLRVIKEKNSDLYLGKTFTPKAGFPDDVICFKFKRNIPVPANVYISVISKELEFIYTSKNKVTALWHNGKELAAGHVFAEDDDKNNVAYKLIEKDDLGKQIAIEKTIVDAIRTEGNLVFIHPDS